MNRAHLSLAEVANDLDLLVAGGHRRATQRRDSVRRGRLPNATVSTQRGEST